MKLSRQTVSKILNDAVKENIVEIRIHNPETACRALEEELCRRFPIQKAIVAGVSTEEETLCRMMTVKKAAQYIASLAEKGDRKIGVSWGRTMQALVSELCPVHAEGNIVFPLFGATDREEPYFLSNEIARSFADTIGAGVKFAWFPYKPDSREDLALFQKTSYYKKLADLWHDMDIAVLGIGNREIIEAFGKNFGYNEKGHAAVGDVATHFFDENGNFLELYENTLCIGTAELKKAGETIAVACGANKALSIVGAMRTGILDTLITDEYAARRIINIL